MLEADAFGPVGRGDQGPMRDVEITVDVTGGSEPALDSRAAMTAELIAALEAGLGGRPERGGSSWSGV